MRAVLMQGGELVVSDVDEPVPGPGQVLIAPHTTGICGSDLHIRAVQRDQATLAPEPPLPPIIPGHEFAGEVVALGPGTDTVANIGDLVTAIPFTHGAAGPETIGISPTFGGGLAGLTVADATRTFRLPDGLDTRLGALTEPVAVAVHAYHQGAETGPLVVVGAGPIGLAIIAIAAIDGRQPIIAVEPAPTRRAAALRFGAQAAYEPGTPLLDLLRDVGYRPSMPSPLLDTDPTVATIFECVGRPGAVQNILTEAPPHSRIVLAGACHNPVDFHPLQATTSEVTITASFAYRPAEFRVAMHLLQQHPATFEAFITSERPLEETGDAFDALVYDPTEIKTLIRPTAARS